MPRRRTSPRTIGALTTITGQQINLRQVASLRGLHLFFGRQTRIDARLDLRMAIHCLLHGFIQG